MMLPLKKTYKLQRSNRMQTHNRIRYTWNKQNKRSEDWGIMKKDWRQSESNEMKDSFACEYYIKTHHPSLSKLFECDEGTTYTNTYNQ